MSESIPNRNETDLMQMSPWDFDQGPNGWRKLQDAREWIKAADLIREYLSTNEGQLSSFEKNILHFHRGQMLAVAGEEYREGAIESFSKSFGDINECWNAYVSATIGFLEGNKEKVERALEVVISSKQEEKRAGNIGIVKNFKKALEQEENDYMTVYSWPREEA